MKINANFLIGSVAAEGFASAHFFGGTLHRLDDDGREREQLKEWVDFANENGAVILYDAAYEYFICDDSLCRSIYLKPKIRGIFAARIK